MMMALRSSQCAAVLAACCRLLSRPRTAAETATAPLQCAAAHLLGPQTAANGSSHRQSCWHAVPCCSTAQCLYPPSFAAAGLTSWQAAARCTSSSTTHAAAMSTSSNSSRTHSSANHGKDSSSSATSSTPRFDTWQPTSSCSSSCSGPGSIVGGAGGSSGGSSRGSRGSPGQWTPSSKVPDTYQLNDAILACSTPQELQQLVQKHGRNMTFINIASAISKLPKLRSPRHQQQQHQQQQPVSCLQLLDQLWQLLQPELLLCCRSRELVNILWASSKLQSENAQLYSSCLEPYLKGAASNTPRHLSNVVYALCTPPAAIRQQHQAAVMQQLVPAFLQQLKGANAHDISNVLYGVADSGQQLKAEQVELVCHLLATLATAKPQDVSNTLWAVATMGRHVQQDQLQQLLVAFIGMLQQAKLQEVANTLWAVATMGRQMQQDQLQQLLAAFVGMLQQAKPQDLSNALWAVATMGRQVQQDRLQQLLAAFAGMLQQGKPQEVINTLWACGKLGFVPHNLLSAPQLTSMLLKDTAQGLANIAWACGQLGHRDEQRMGALLQEALQRLAADSCSINTQELCNMCWSIAVLDLQQHADQVLRLVQACSQQRGSMCNKENLPQLWQVHTWLLDFHLAGGQGLAGTLTQQQLEQCKAAWDKQQAAMATQAASPLQSSVFAAVQQLPISWEQPPQMEQLSVGRDGVTDGALLIDITAKTASGVLLAIEVDGPSHFRQPDGGLTGPTQFRNRALAVRGYKLVSIPWYDWRNLKGDKQQQQQQYMSERLEAVGAV